MSKLAVAHERTFGVEIECGHRNGCEYVQYQMKSAGFSIAENPPIHLSGAETNAFYYSGYTVGYDGSGVEVRTPILKGVEGFRELKRIFKFLNSLNCYTTQSDGMHVHHGAPELIDDPRLTLLLLKEWVAQRPIICDMVGSWRDERISCPAWTQNLVDHYEAYINKRPTTVNGHPTRQHYGRRELNVSSLDSKGTVEVRLHEGNLDYEIAKAWIKFFQKFMHKTITSAHPLPPIKNREELLKQIRLTKQEREVLEAKSSRRR